MRKDDVGKHFYGAGRLEGKVSLLILLSRASFFRENALSTAMDSPMLP